IPSAEHTINIAQMFYEMSLLAIPRKKIHPDVLSGESHSEMLDLLDQYSLTEDEVEEFFSDETSESNEDIDPRWEVLKKLKNNNNGKRYKLWQHQRQDNRLQEGINVGLITK